MLNELTTVVCGRGGCHRVYRVLHPERNLYCSTLCATWVESPEDPMQTRRYRWGYVGN